MSHDDPYDDEDWHDDEEDFDDEESAHCPECGGPIYRAAEKCPACGYWLSDADRRALWSGEARPAWQKITAVVVLVAFLVAVLGLAAILI